MFDFEKIKKRIGAKEEMIYVLTFFIFL